MEIDDQPGIGGEGEREACSQGFVEGSLPPGCQAPAGNRPAQTFGGYFSAGIHGKDRYLLAGYAWQCGCLQYGDEASVIGDHFYCFEQGEKSVRRDMFPSVCLPAARLLPGSVIFDSQKNGRTGRLLSGRLFPGLPPHGYGRRIVRAFPKGCCRGRQRWLSVSVPVHADFVQPRRRQ